MATHSSILTWRIPWTVACQAPLSMGSQELDTTEATEHKRTVFSHLDLCEYILKKADNKN